jgi:hypothetical protein
VKAVGREAAGRAASCCFFAPGGLKAASACGTCSSFAGRGEWCAESEGNCAACSGLYCAAGGPAAATTPAATTTARRTTTARKATSTTKVVGTAAVTAKTTRAGSGGGDSFCCFYSTQLADKCGSCQSKSTPEEWCSQGEAACKTCSGVYCAGRPGAATTTTTAAPPSPTKSSTAPATTKWVTKTSVTTTTAGKGSTAAPPPPSAVTWTEGTWTTGYWDCMKPSCSWPGKGRVTAPVRACSASSGGKVFVDAAEPSVREGGDAVSCTNNQPWAVSSRLSFGFTAAAVSGQHGLQGDGNCGQCYMLRFVDKIHPNGNWGGAHPDLVGHTMVVQVTNIGYDVSGEHSFDLQLPSAGQGAFTTGCDKQFPGYRSGDFDCDNNYGGCSSKAGCSRLPPALQSGCAWRFDVYKWLVAAGKTNNPYVKFARVRCPAELTAISGAAPLDDSAYPAHTTE